MELHELVEMEIRELLSKYDYDGDNTAVVKGSALAASNGSDPELGEKKVRFLTQVLELLKLMDETIPIPERPIDKTFMMSVDSTFTIPGRGTVVTGTIEQGRVKVGEDIEIVGYSDKATKTTVTGSFLLLRRSRDLPEESGGGRSG